MKKCLLLLPFLFLSLYGFAQNVELSKALLEEFQMKQNPIMQKSANITDHHQHLWMTPFLKKVLSNWDVLTQEAKDVFGVYTTPPSFSGDELIYVSAPFKLHYTVNSGKAGEDVETVDTDSDGVPDYVENMAETFNTVQLKYHTQIALTPPVYTDGFYHIYLSGDEAGDGTYGYVSTDPESIVGDNPHSTDVVELDAATSYMVMRNNYDGFGNPDIALKVTAAHEYMHAIQYGCDWEIEYWFSEATAVWGEEYVFPGFDDNFQYLTSVLSTPDWSLNLDDSEGEDFEGHWYGTFLFVQYLSEQTNTTIVGDIYKELIGDLQDESMTIDAINKVLKANASYVFSDFDDLFGSYALANTIISEDEMFAPFIYKRADDYYNYLENDAFSLYYEEAQFEYTGTDILFNSNVDGNGQLMRLSHDPFDLSADENFKLTLTPDGDSDVDMVLVKMSEDTAQIVVSDENYEINVLDNESWYGYYIAVIRWDSDETETTPSNYRLSITQATSALDETMSKNLVLSPNPASQFFTIATDEVVSTLSILDLSGHTIEVKTPNAINQYEVSTLPSGAYLVKIESQNRVLLQKLIIE